LGRLPDQGVTLQNFRPFGQEFKKIPATTAGNFIGLHGRNAGFFMGWDQDGWMLKRAVGFDSSTLQR